MLDSFLGALGVAPGRIPAGLDERASLYRSLLDGRRVLVVLDNANTPEQVRPLLPASRRCLALITSRASLIGLVISQGAARLSLDLLPENEAVALLRGIVGAARADAEPDAVAGIVRACVRLPLALRVAGQRAAARPRRPLAEVLAELGDQHERLDALSATGDEATAVRAVFAWSYQALPPEQALAFRRLGLHPGVEIDVYAAAALTQTTPAETRRNLEALAAVHLVEPTARDRYRAHDLLRAYALECAKQEECPEERDAALLRLLGFYLHTADAADRNALVRARFDPDAAPAPRHPLALDTARQALDWFDAEYANLTATARLSAEVGQHALAWQLPAVLNGLFDISGHRGDWTAALHNGLAAARVLGDRRGEGYTLVSLSGAMAQLCRFDEAVAYAQQALAIALQNDDRVGEGSALIELGRAHLGALRAEDAADCMRRAREILLESGDTWFAAIALNELGVAYLKLGRLDDALDCHTQALDAFRLTHDPGREGWALRLLGNAHQAAGRLDVAADFQRRSLDIARQVGDRHGQGEALRSIATNLSAAGDQHAAREFWREALTIFEQLGDPQANDIRTRLGGN